MTLEIKEDLGVGELNPGVTKRRWEPEGGVDKLRHRIHKESKHVDKYKNLPFTFSKPKKSGKRKIVECNNCGKVTAVPINTVGVICSNCHSYASVKEVSEDGE